MSGTEIGSEAPAQPVLPFGPASPPSSADPPCGLSLQQAASLHVELASLVGGVSRGDVLRRYGLTGEHEQEIHRYWSGRIAADGSIREQWTGACAAYRAWLLQQRRQPG